MCRTIITLYQFKKLLKYMNSKLSLMYYESVQEKCPKLSYTRHMLKTHQLWRRHEIYLNINILLQSLIRKFILNIGFGWLVIWKQWLVIWYEIWQKIILHKRFYLYFQYLWFTKVICILLYSCNTIIFQYHLFA